MVSPLLEWSIANFRFVVAVILVLFLSLAASEAWSPQVGQLLKDSSLWTQILLWPVLWAVPGLLGLVIIGGVYTAITQQRR